MNLDGQVAIVTGGGGVIGKGIADILAKCGAIVVLGDVEMQTAERAAQDIARKGFTSLPLRLDVTEELSISTAVEIVLQRYRRINILVNNAGAFTAPGWESRFDLSEEDWDWTFKVNLKGVAVMSESVLPFMKQQREGKIINIASSGGRMGAADNPAYLSSKAGVINFTQSLALQLAPFNINVNAICPGAIWSGMSDPANHLRRNVTKELKGLSPRQMYNHFVQKTPLQRGQTAEDIGYLAAFLASEHSRNITGQAINVDGGKRMN